MTQLTIIMGFRLTTGCLNRVLLQDKLKIHNKYKNQFKVNYHNKHSNHKEPTILLMTIKE